MISNITNPTDLSGLYFIYHGSTNLETKGIYGISHLGEHLKCKCFEYLQDELQENGISWNAYTSNNSIVFYFNGLEEFLAPLRNTLIERMYAPVDSFLTEELFLKEKKIVLEEYNDCFTDQTETFMLNLSRKHWNDYSAVGLKEDLETMTYSQFLEFYSRQYEKPDRIINISKKHIIEKEFEFENRKNIIRNYSTPETCILEQSADFPDNLIMFFYRFVEKTDAPIMSIIQKMMSSGLNSPLYQEIREKRALCYNVRCMLESLGDSYLLGIMTSTTPDKKDIVTSTLENVFLEKHTHMTQKRFDLIKKSIVIAKKKKEIDRHNTISEFLNETLDAVNEIIEKLTLDEVMVVYDKYFKMSDFVSVTDREF